MESVGKEEARYPNDTVNVAVSKAYDDKLHLIYPHIAQDNQTDNYYT